MKLDKEYFENEGFRFERVSANIGKCSKNNYHEIYFELDTLEEIGVVTESDVRTSWSRYYTARIFYKWDGKQKTKKEFVKTLCTRGDYTTAKAMLLQEYKARHSA